MLRIIAAGLLVVASATSAHAVQLYLYTATFSTSSDAGFESDVDVAETFATISGTITLDETLIETGPAFGTTVRSLFGPAAVTVNEFTLSNELAQQELEVTNNEGGFGLGGGTDTIDGEDARIIQAAVDDGEDGIFNFATQIFVDADESVLGVDALLPAEILLADFESAVIEIGGLQIVDAQFAGFEFALFDIQTLERVELEAVPLPSSSILLIGALGAFGALSLTARRRRMSGS